MVQIVVIFSFVIHIVLGQLHSLFWAKEYQILLFEKKHTLGQSIVSSERVLKLLLEKEHTLGQSIVSNERHFFWVKEYKIYCLKRITPEGNLLYWVKECWKLLLEKEHTWGQSIVLSERVSKSIVENNEKLKRYMHD